MIWSKIKKRVKDKFADSVKKNLNFYITPYAGGESECRAWITISGNEIVNFCTSESNVHFGAPYSELTVDERTWRHPKVEDAARTPGLLIEKGEFSALDFAQCCYYYLDLNISVAQQSNHPIIRMFSVLDRRTGKRKLLELEKSESNPLVKYFIRYRINVK